MVKSRLNSISENIDDKQNVLELGEFVTTTDINKNGTEVDTSPPQQIVEAKSRKKSAVDSYEAVLIAESIGGRKASMDPYITDLITEVVHKKKIELEIDEALYIAGFGSCNLRYCLILALFLTSVTIELTGFSFVLQAIKCDFNISESQLRLYASLPYVGIILSVFIWGYLVDTRGRKHTLVYSAYAAGSLSVLAALMPSLKLFLTFKIFCWLCLTCSSFAPYSYIGEILPPKERDFILSITTSLQAMGAAVVPLIAWGILSLNVNLNFGMYDFQSWRLLTIIYSCFLIISAFLLSFGIESPQYLISKGKHDQSLQVLQMMYASNKGKTPDQYPVKQLKIPEDGKIKYVSFINSLKKHTLPLLKGQYLIWLLLTGVLHFSINATLNGLYLWLPHGLHRFLVDPDESLTICKIITQTHHETLTHNSCHEAFTLTNLIYSVSMILCAFFSMGLSSLVKYLGKKTLLVFVFVSTGFFCIISVLVTEKILVAVLVAWAPLLLFLVGPINAYIVEMFPTNLRGMALALSMMIGYYGSLMSTDVISRIIVNVCHSTFYGLGGTAIVCGLFSLLLPGKISQTISTEPTTIL